MKKIWLQLFISLISYTTTYGQQEQNLSVKTAIALYNKDAESVKQYIQHKGYKFVRAQGNFRQYKKDSQNISDFTLAQRNSIITVISWTEFLGNLDPIQRELERIGFKLENSGNYIGGMMLNYTNLGNNIMITLITRNDYNDFKVNLGSIKDKSSSLRKQPVRSAQKAVKTDEASVQVTENFLIKIAAQPLLINIPIKSLATSDFYIENGTQIGVIQKTFKDKGGEMWLTICYKDRLGRSGIKGYILVDINTAHYFDANGDSDEISKSDGTYFRQIILPGRRVEFQTERRGTGVLGYENLTYIKPLSNSSLNINGTIRIEKYFVGG